MKGLLKGLRYISQIFDAKEPEMKIGNPTDVKHVAHIGWDNASSVTTPSWMQDFKAAPGPSKGGESEPSQAGGGGEAGECEPGEGGAGGRAEQTERPRRTTKGKGSGASVAKRRDGAGEELQHDRRTPKAEAEGGEGDAAAASKQQRRKPRPSGGGTSSGGRSKSSSGGAPASDSEAARSAAAPGAEDNRNCY